MRDKDTYDESQVPDKVKNTIHDFKRTTLESMDLSELVQVRQTIYRIMKHLNELLISSVTVIFE